MCYAYLFNNISDENDNIVLDSNLCHHANTIILTNDTENNIAKICSLLEKFIPTNQNIMKSKHISSHHKKYVLVFRDDNNI